ncbi:hypothetical protein [Plastoroseomonas hellenica]|uniref:Uncharacterized protein n=1 Tax=Plastoroseomonas hellenica TaxID=2687306 RepID=A0ABS5F848_9PROT|nr:hypothetical protein [Plastoroseomonas hellenica]MBR0646808.1 hypothetical protein [Plastoroseomonas hellenica]MBR0668744.1 hypothetical protein [Plastoroseomonas hellenica]
MPDWLRAMMTGLGLAGAVLAIQWALGLGGFQDAEVIRDPPPMPVVMAG